MAAPIRRVVERLMYKPNWRLAVLNPVRPGLWPRLAFEYRSIDSVDGSVDGYFGRSVDIDPQADPSHVIEEMLRLVLDAELHEVLEWFRVDGERVLDPHAHDSADDQLGGNPPVGGVRLGRAVVALLEDPAALLLQAQPFRVPHPWPEERPAWPTDEAIALEVLAERARRFPEQESPP